MADQEHSRFEYDSASGRVETIRRWLLHAIKLFAAVSGVVTPAGTSTPFDGSRPANDDQLIARVAAIAPAGALNALRQARRIGPRVEADDQPGETPAGTTTPAAPPVPDPSTPVKAA